MNLWVQMDERGPYVITRVDDMIAVEDALPSGWTIGDNWWASDPSQEVCPGWWKLYLMRPEDVGGAKNAQLEEITVPKIITPRLVDRMFSAAAPPMETVAWLTAERDPGGFEANYPKQLLDAEVTEQELYGKLGAGNFILRAFGQTQKELGSMRLSLGTKTAAAPLSVGHLVARAQKAEEELAAARAEIAALRAAKPRATMFVPGSEEHVAFWNAVNRYKDCNNFLTREQLVADLEAAAVALFRPSGSDANNPVQTLKRAFAHLRKFEQVEDSLRCITNTILQLIEDRDDARTAVRANQHRHSNEIVALVRRRALEASERSLEHEKSDGRALTGIQHVMASCARDESNRLYGLSNEIGHKFLFGRAFSFEGRGSLLAGLDIGRLNDRDALNVVLGVVERAEERIESLQWMLAERKEEIERAALATASGIHKRAKAAALSKLDSTAPWEHFDVMNEFDCEQEALAAIASKEKK